MYLDSKFFKGVTINFVSEFLIESNGIISSMQVDGSNVALGKMLFEVSYETSPYAMSLSGWLNRHLKEAAAPFAVGVEEHAAYDLLGVLTSTMRCTEIGQSIVLPDRAQQHEWRRAQTQRVRHLGQRWRHRAACAGRCSVAPSRYGRALTNSHPGR